MTTTWRGRTRAAFTLVELVLAVSVAALLITLLFSLYLTLSRTVDDQHERRIGGVALVRALDRITQDLISAQPVPGYEEGGFSLDTQDGARGPASSVSFCTARTETWGADADERDLRWFELLEVTYHLERKPRERGRLIRTERPLVGPGSLGPAQTHVLANGVNAFHLRVWIDGEWTGEWTREADDDEGGWPTAARIHLVPDDDMRGAQPQTVDVLMPTGLTFEPDDEG